MTDRDFQAIRALVLDVDGVMTDGRIHLAPDGAETKVFNVRDGWAMRHWQNTGRSVAIITGRASPAVERRAAELGVDVVHVGAKQKLPAYRAVLAELGVNEDQAAVMGDDWPDVPLMRRCGLAVAPADAAEEVREMADLVTVRGGGAGCVREVVETILKATGDWTETIARYTDDERQQ